MEARRLRPPESRKRGRCGESVAFGTKCSSSWRNGTGEHGKFRLRRVRWTLRTKKVLSVYCVRRRRCWTPEGTPAGEGPPTAQARSAG